MKNNHFMNIIKENPVFVSLLGIVPVLGATIFSINAFIMGLATFFVLIFSNLLISFIKEYINPQTEVFLYILSTALFTTIVTVIIKFIDIDLYNSLGIYLPLIVVNCLILNSLNKSISKESVKTSFLISIKFGVYFILAITIIGIIREFLGNGSLFNYVVIPESMPKILLSQTPAGGFFILALMSMIANKLREGKA